MKKLLAGMILVLVMAFGFGINSANATFWTPDDNNVNFSRTFSDDFNASEILGIFSPDTVIAGGSFGDGDYLHIFPSQTNVKVMFDYDNSNNLWVASWDGKTLDLGSSKTFQLGYYDGTNWKTDTGYLGEESSYAVYFGNKRVSQTDANPSVPIPAAVWLLGSGLFGMVAIRRRSKKIDIGKS